MKSFLFNMNLQERKLYLQMHEILHQDKEKYFISINLKLYSIG